MAGATGFRSLLDVPPVRRSEDDFAYEEPEKEEFVSMAEQVEQLPIYRTTATVTEVRSGGKNRQREIEEMLGELDDPAAERRLESRQDREFPNTGYIRVKPDEDMDWVPGQFVGFHYNGVPRAYSIANSPTTDDTGELEFCVRRVPDGKLSPQLCDDIEVGDEVYLKGPDTLDLLLEDPSHRDMVFMATGTGVAPLKAMIDYTFENGWDTYHDKDRDVWLFLGASWEDDLPYHEELSELAVREDNFHYVPTVSREEYLNDEWDGQTQYIQHVLTDYLESSFGRERNEYNINTRIDPENVELYLCGITAMVNSVDPALRAAGVDPEAYQAEPFG